MDADFNVTNANVFSEALNGTSDWKKVTVDIPATEGCYSLVVKATSRRAVLALRILMIFI